MPLGWLSYLTVPLPLCELNNFYHQFVITCIVIVLYLHYHAGSGGGCRDFSVYFNLGPGSDGIWKFVSFYLIWEISI